MTKQLIDRDEVMNKINSHFFKNSCKGIVSLTDDIFSLPIESQWIELDIAYPNKGIDVECQDEDGTIHYAFQCQYRQPGCREWRDQVTGGGLMISPKRWRIEAPTTLTPK